MNKQVFDCKMCGQCCTGEGGIIVTYREIERICKYLSIEISDFLIKFTQKTPDGKYSLSTKTDGSCVFFNPHKGCKIHMVKPDICLAWPFFKGNLEDEYSFFLAKEYCPGISRDVSFEEFRKYGLKFLREHDLLKKDKDAPNALKIDSDY